MMRTQALFTIFLRCMAQFVPPIQFGLIHIFFNSYVREASKSSSTNGQAIKENDFFKDKHTNMQTGRQQDNESKWHSGKVTK